MVVNVQRILTSYFKLNKFDAVARAFLYSEIPQFDLFNLY